MAMHCHDRTLCAKYAEMEAEKEEEARRKVEAVKEQQARRKRERYIERERVLCPPEENTITVFARGCVFYVSKDVLCKDEESMLAQLVKYKTVAGENSIVLDVDAAAFQQITLYLETGLLTARAEDEAVLLHYAKRLLLRELVVELGGDVSEDEDEDADAPNRLAESQLCVRRVRPLDDHQLFAIQVTHKDDIRRLHLRQGFSFEDFHGAIRGRLGLEGDVMLYYKDDMKKSCTLTTDDLEDACIIAKRLSPPTLCISVKRVECQVTSESAELQEATGNPDYALDRCVHYFLF
jgi:hypothetical protein